MAVPDKPTRFRLRKPPPRLSARQRGYSHLWERRSRQWLRQQYDALLAAGDWSLIAKLPSGRYPPCIDCLTNGVITEANEVDHEIPHRGDMRLFWDESNWRARCHSCHSRKTATRDGGLGK
jgi:5-methylcytosine-specific restriction protein A